MSTLSSFLLYYLAQQKMMLTYLIKDSIWSEYKILLKGIKCVALDGCIEFMCALNGLAVRFSDRF
jgi:hypothetical protein